ncbi:MAG: hypothetical protein JWO66_1385 [Candidatus Eremiobacteraeota bacterium]|jgi:hypothetical protein|nr:hypothetical protein [Candidatus Eremiobacteraeota bacterium]
MKDAAAPGPALDPPAAALVSPASAAATLGADVGVDTPASLPRDHPAWQRDVLAVSARVRAIVAQLRPVVVRALTFWDHAVRGVAIGRRRVELDPSGSYRLV